MKNLSLIAVLALFSGVLVGCSKAESDPMTQPRAASTEDPATAPNVHVDRQGNPVKAGPASATPPAAGGGTDRNGNPTGG